MKQLDKRVIVALDTQDFKTCKQWVKSLKGLIHFYKIGSELFTSVGLDAVNFVLDQGADVFLDLKFHDIPNTVAQSARAVAGLGIKMFNVHTLGGFNMMSAAKEAIAGTSWPRPLARADRNKPPLAASLSRPWILGVTILTSHSEKDLKKDLRIKSPLKNQVLHLAVLARKAGLDGVVASAQEVALIKKKLGKSCLVVTPGIRPLWAVKGDQTRIVTPKQAFRLGADYIVVGRPITGAEDMRGAAQKVIKEVVS